MFSKILSMSQILPFIHSLIWLTNLLIMTLNIATWYCSQPFSFIPCSVHSFETALHFLFSFKKCTTVWPSLGSVIETEVFATNNYYIFSPITLFSLNVEMVKTAFYGSVLTSV